MTLTELRYIVAVAKEKHFGKAAEICCVSQPTLSVGIRKLEDGLGVSIFERGRSEVKVTPIGVSIIEQAERALRETQRIKNIAEQEKDQLKKPISIASTFTIGKYLFPMLIKEAYHYSPKLAFSFSQDYHEELLSKLAQDELDILFLTSCNIGYRLIPEISLDNFNIEPILHEKLYLLAAKNNKYAKASSVSLNDLCLSDLHLLNKHHCLHHQILNLKESWHLNENDYTECNFDTLESLYQVIKLNNGATIVPASFNQDLDNYELGDINLIPFDEPAPARTISLVWRKNFTRTQVLDILRQSLSGVNDFGLQPIEA